MLLALPLPRSMLIENSKDLTMTKLLVGINCYLEENLLPQCLTNIRSTLPEAEIVVIDGAYQSWVTAVKIEAAKHLEQGYHEIGIGLLKFINPISIDRTHEICQQFKVEHLELPPKENGEYIPWPSEAKKRNEFFKYGNNGDVWYFIDADEGIQGHPAEVIDNAYNVMLQRDDNLPPYCVQRIFRHQPSIRMEGAHHALWVGDKLYKRDDPERKTIAGTMLMHYYDKRNQLDRMRHLAKGAYYRNGLLPEEQYFRAVHNI